jgi:hypothetical protein
MLLLLLLWLQHLHARLTVPMLQRCSVLMPHSLESVCQCCCCCCGGGDCYVCASLTHSRCLPVLLLLHGIYAPSITLPLLQV